MSVYNTGVTPRETVQIQRDQIARSLDYARERLIELRDEVNRFEAETESLEGQLAGFDAWLSEQK